MSTVGKRFYSLIAIFALSVAGLVTVTFPASASVVETLTFSPEQTSIIQTGTAASFRVIPDSEPVAGSGRMDWAPFANASLNASSLVDWLPDGGAWNKGWKVKNDVGTSNQVLYVQKPLNSDLGSSLTLLNRTDNQTILSADSKVVTAKIKATTAAVKVAMRITNNVGGSITVNSVTGAANQWSTLTFDFAGAGAIGKFDAQTSYKKLELILDTDHAAAGANGAPNGPEPQGKPAASTSKLYLIDDISYKLAPAPRGTSVVMHRFNAQSSTGLLANPADRGPQPWFSFYHSTVKYYSAIAFIGSTLSLKWRVTDSSGLPAANTRVNLLVNKEFSGSNATFTSPGIVFTSTQTVIPGTTDGSGNVSFALTNTNTGGLASPPDINAPNSVRGGDIYTQVALLLPGGDQKNEGQDILDIIFVSKTPSPTPSGSPSPSASPSTSTSPSPSPSPTPTPSAPLINVTFESSDTSGYSLIDFNTNMSSISAPPTGGTAGSLRALKIVKGADAAAGTTFLKTNASGKTLASSSHKKVTMKVYSAVAGKKVMLKVEDALHPENCVEAFATESTVVGWKTLTFDLSAQRTGTAAFKDTYTYNMASIFFDFLGTTAGAIYYVDDIEFNGSGTPTPTPVPVGAELTPTFSSPVATATGFTVNVTNYNASYTFTPSLIAGSGTATAGTAAGPVLPIAVSGVTAGAGTLQIATSRTGYTSGLASVSGNALPVVSLASTASSTRGAAVTITGTNLWGATAVRVGTSTTASTKFTVVSPTSIVFNTATAATGAVTVITPGGTAIGPSITISATLTVPGAVTMSATTGGPGTAITLTGSNLGATTAVVRGAVSIPFKVIATNQLLLAIPAGLTTGTLTITTPGGVATSPSYTAASTPVAPTITSAAQTIKRSTLATITGNNLGAVTSMTINGTAITDYTVLSATSISVRIPGTATVGASTIAITTAGGTVSTATVSIS